MPQPTGPRRFPRRKAHENLVFGRQPVLALLEGEQDVDRVLIQGGAQGDVIQDIRDAARKRRVPVRTVPREKLNALTGGQHQGAIAFASPIRFQDLGDVLSLVIESGEAPLIIVLDGVQDVRNLGAIARTAWAAGAHALVIPAQDGAPVNADAVKTSAGALQEMPVCRSFDLHETLQELKLHGLAIWGAEAKGDHRPDGEDLTLPTAIILGGESSGLDPELRQDMDGLMGLPMAREFESYNVGVAAGMLLYEAQRQRSDA